MDFLATFFDNYGMLLAQGTWDTLLMTIVSTFFAYVIGIPLGVLCVLTSPKGLMPHRIFNMVLGWIINIGRSIPFIILLVALIPFTWRSWRDRATRHLCGSHHRAHGRAVDRRGRWWPGGSGAEFRREHLADRLQGILA